MPSASKVFINIAYDKKREPILLGLTAALIALGRIPKLTSLVLFGIMLARHIGLHKS